MWLRHGQLRVNSQHGVPEPTKLLIAARIRARTPRVIAAIDFHDEPSGRRQEIRDELVANDDLPPKRDAELAPTNEVLERRFRRCELKAHLARACSEERAIAVRVTTEHGDLLLPAERPGFAPLWRRLYDARPPC